MRGHIQYLVFLILVLVSNLSRGDTGKFEAEFDLVENEMDRDFIKETKSRVRERCKQTQHTCLEESDKKTCDRLLKKTPGCELLLDVGKVDRLPAATTPMEEIGALGKPAKKGVVTPILTTAKEKNLKIADPAMAKTASGVVNASKAPDKDEDEFEEEEE